MVKANERVCGVDLKKDRTIVMETIKHCLFFITSSNNLMGVGQFFLRGHRTEEEVRQRDSPSPQDSMLRIYWVQS